MENALYDFYSLVELYQKSHSFPAFPEKDGLDLFDSNYLSVCLLRASSNLRHLKQRNDKNNNEITLLH